MATEQEFLKGLKEIIKVLYDEKEALLDSDGHKVAEILEIKNEYIEKLAQFKGMDVQNNEKAMSLIEEINSLQEINLLLTKQALSYQEVLLESIAKNINNLTNTYSPKGSKNASNSINLIDQSV